ncbi:MAG: YhbY family RNA-binding protein [Clostridia bacterium]|nr:YhbY family RNA-binding protein [Clostridia bacterium]
MLTSKQRAHLRSIAQSYDTIFQIGKGGLSEETVKTVSDALEARELIKLRTLDNCSYSPREAAEALAEACMAEVVCVTGSRFVLWRCSSKEKNRKIEP